MIYQKANGEEHESRAKIREALYTTEPELTLYALRDALQRFKYGCRITVHTQCHFVAAAFGQGWLYDWPHNGWKTVKGKEVRHSVLWDQVLKEIMENGHKMQVVTDEDGRMEEMQETVKSAHGQQDFFTELEV